MWPGTLPKALVLAFLLAAIPACKGARSAEQSSIVDRIDEIATRVATLRDLRRKRAISHAMLSRADIETRLRARLREDHDRAELAAETLVLQQLGLLPAKADYRAIIERVLLENAAGFYDPHDKQLYLADWQQTGIPTMDDPVAAHEVAHALVDQHFKLERYLRRVKDNADAVLARRAVIEGDASAVMLEYPLAEEQVLPWASPQALDLALENLEGATRTLAAYPLIIRASTLFPYAAGLRFIAHFRRTAPWSKIDQMYRRRPPLSTEHILHPETYEAYERPVEIAAQLPPSLGSFTAIYDNRMGEFTLGVFLQQHGISQTRAQSAATGWGGDRLVFYQAAERAAQKLPPIGVSYVVFDTELDANEYFEALSDALTSLAGAAPSAQTHDSITFIDKNKRTFSARHETKRVITILRAPEAKLNALFTDIDKAWKLRK